MDFLLVVARADSFEMLIRLEAQEEGLKWVIIAKVVRNDFQGVILLHFYVPLHIHFLQDLQLVVHA